MLRILSHTDMHYDIKYYLAVIKEQIYTIVRGWVYDTNTVTLENRLSREETKTGSRIYRILVGKGV